jgi:hypothetical protein
VDNKYKKKIFLFLLIFCFFLIKADFVSALEQTYPPIFGLDIGEGTLPEYARYFFNIGMAIAGILATIVIVFGGVYYLISFGMGKFTDEGKQWVKAGVLGLILTVSAYLIAYTINPSLVAFNLNGLLGIPFDGLFGRPPANTTPFVYYNEIPIGTLTENVLSKTMDCYDFDSNGDPIEGSIKTDDNQIINGPTLLNHDRVDCFLKIAKAAEKKADQIRELSEKIATLMGQCSCEGKCDTTCNINSGCVVSGDSCTGSCKGAACKFFTGNNITDCCPTDSGIRNPNSNKNFTVKEIIEHGPIRIGDQEEICAYFGKEFKGLDEFRTGLTSISNFIEVSPKPKLSGKEVSIIRNGNCQICESNDTGCQNSRKTCLRDSPWGNLKLIEQLTYFKEKMEQIKTNIEADKNQLKSAENILGQCYLAEPYIDFLKTFEKTKKEEKTILIQRNFNDPETQQQIGIYKYCKGFDYANSDAYSKCQNICPETLKNKGCYQECTQCPGENLEQQALCNKCMKACYDVHACPAPANSNPMFATFKTCIDGFIQQCSNECNTLCSQEEIQKCKNACGDDSKCLLENEEKCTVNFPQLKFCSDSYEKPENLKNCIDNSYLCKYCSDQYAGYPDCVKTLGGQYSSSFLYQNPSAQKCINPYGANRTSSIENKLTCLVANPEVAKCPSASMCPKCPCGIVNETISSPNNETACPSGSCRGDDGICSPGNCNPANNSGNNNSSGSSSGSSSTRVLGYRVCTADCSEYSYNDDPLTFYCQQNWWYKENKIEEKTPTPIGQEKVCSKENEIPIGQTIDDTEKWVDELSKKISDFTITIDKMVQYITTIGREQNYCKCDSTCKDGKPCASNCKYVEGVCSGDPVVCSEPECIVQPCLGISCQKVINMLKGGKTQNCPAQQDGVSYYYNKIKGAYQIFYSFVIIEGRSDLVKKLSYSREKMNEASTAQSAFGGEAKILSCERAQDEIISPIKGGNVVVNGRTIKDYCYGKNLGKILNIPEPMADNWFYCEERQGINE